MRDAAYAPRTKNTSPMLPRNSHNLSYKYAKRACIFTKWKNTCLYNRKIFNCVAGSVYHSISRIATVFSYFFFFRQKIKSFSPFSPRYKKHRQTLADLTVEQFYFTAETDTPHALRRFRAKSRRNRQSLAFRAFCAWEHCLYAYRSECRRSSFPLQLLP